MCRMRRAACSSSLPLLPACCCRNRRRSMRSKFLIPLLLALWIAPAHATEVQEIKTQGGITAWLVEEHSLPLLAVKIAFQDAGFAYDAGTNAGRAAMLGDLLLEGAGSYDS